MAFGRYLSELHKVCRSDQHHFSQWLRWASEQLHKLKHQTANCLVTPLRKHTVNIWLLLNNPQSDLMGVKHHNNKHQCRRKICWRHKFPNLPRIRRIDEQWAHVDDSCLLHILLYTKLSINYLVCREIFATIYGTGLGCPMPNALGSFRSATIPETLSTPLHRTHACKFVKCAEQRPPLARVYAHWVLSFCNNTPSLEAHSIPQKACMHANLSGVQSGGDHLPHFMALPWVANPLGTFLQKYPITGGNLRSTGPSQSHFLHHYQHLCSTLVR